MIPYPMVMKVDAHIGTHKTPIILQTTLNRVTNNFLSFFSNFQKAHLTIITYAMVIQSLFLQKY